MAGPANIRRLTAQDAAAYSALRIEGFKVQPEAFRFSPEDEARVTPAAVRDRLTRDYVIGAFADGQLVGIAGLAQMSGDKLSHRAMLWGMYLQAGHRGSGLADAMMRAVLDHAATIVQSVVLTVVSDNPRAVRFYQRWGFTAYGQDVRAIRQADGSYADEMLMVRHFAP